jgi:hypothetical protein
MTALSPMADPYSSPTILAPIRRHRGDPSKGLLPEASTRASKGATPLAMRAYTGTTTLLLQHAINVRRVGDRFKHGRFPSSSR